MNELGSLKRRRVVERVWLLGGVRLRGRGEVEKGVGRYVVAVRGGSAWVRLRRGAGRRWRWVGLNRRCLAR